MNKRKTKANQRWRLRHDQIRGRILCRFGARAVDLHSHIGAGRTCGSHQLKRASQGCGVRRSLHLRFGHLDVAKVDGEGDHRKQGDHQYGRENRDGAVSVLAGSLMISDHSCILPKVFCAGLNSV